MILILLILLFFPVATWGETPNYALAFANAKGNLLISVKSHASDSKQWNRAACADGHLYTIRFLKEQKGGEKNTNRDSANNFDQLGGNLFQIESGIVKEMKYGSGATCILLDKDYLQDKKFISLVDSYWKPKCTATQILHIRALYENWSMEDCWVLFPGNKDAPLLIASFFPKPTKGLFVLAMMVQADNWAIKEYPVQLKKQDDFLSCWRVDDGCEFDPNSIEIPFVFIGEETEVLSLWGAPEGESIIIFRAVGKGFRKVFSGYRYQAPM